MSAIAGYNTTLKITNPTPLTMTSEAMTDSGDHTTFRVTNANKVYWDDTAAFTVETSPDGTTWSTASAGTYTIQYVGGIITFTSAVTGGTPSCRVSGSYFAWAYLGNADSCDIQTQVDMKDITTYSTGTPTRFKTYMPTLMGATVKLHRYWIDNTFFGYVTRSVQTTVTAGGGSGSTSVTLGTVAGLQANMPIVFGGGSFTETIATSSGYTPSANPVTLVSALTSTVAHTTAAYHGYGNGAKVILSTYLGQTATQRIEAYCRVKQEDMKVAVAGVSEESLDLQITGTFYYVP
jgi:hypothetical protein